MNKKILLLLAALFFVIDCALVTYHLKHKNKKEKKKVLHTLNKEHYKYSIYLTSDDGPLKSSQHLNQLVLDYEFPLTLFLVGKPLSEDKKLEKILSEYKNNPYIILGNHSFSHANFHYKRFYKTPNKVVKDFDKNEKFLGIYSKLARLPGRNVWAIDTILKGEKDALLSAKKLSEQKQYRLFGWDYELRFNRFKIPTKNALAHYKAIKKLLKQKQTFAKNQIVILMHDQMFRNKESQKMLGELVFLFQNDPECKLKFLKDFKIEFSETQLATAQ